MSLSYGKSARQKRTAQLSVSPVTSKVSSKARTALGSHIEPLTSLDDFSSINNNSDAVQLSIGPKLQISRPDDTFEQEAHKIAEQIVTMDDPQIVNSSANHEALTTTSNCHTCDQNTEAKYERVRVRRKALGEYGQKATYQISNEIESIRGSSGFPIDPSTKQFMESRFGQDFSSVRIHADDKAARSADSINARAYTIGSDIIFGDGQYSPRTADGRRLLAHELTHVVQQGQTERIHRDPKGDKKVTQLPDIIVTPDEAPLDKEVADFYDSVYPDTLRDVRDGFLNALLQFSDDMRFPPDKEAEPSTLKVFGSLLKDTLKWGYDTYVKDALAAEFPGIGTAIKVITAINDEIERAEAVSSQHVIRDFLINTRSAIWNPIQAQLDDYKKNKVELKEKTRIYMHSGITAKEYNNILTYVRKFRATKTPTLETFQGKIVSAYIQSQTGQSEKGFLGLDYQNLGQITVKYDEDGEFDSATVSLRSGTGSGQVADQINKLFTRSGSINLKELGVRIQVGVKGESVSGTTATYYVTLDPPDFRRTCPWKEVCQSYDRLKGDPLRVPKVEG